MSQRHEEGIPLFVSTEITDEDVETIEGEGWKIYAYWGKNELVILDGCDSVTLSMENVPALAKTLLVICKDPWEDANL